MNRLLVVLTILAAFMLVVLFEQPEDARKLTKKADTVLITTPLEAIETHRKYESVKEDAFATSQELEKARKEIAQLRQQLATKEAELEKAKAQAIARQASQDQAPPRQSKPVAAKATNFEASHYTARCTGCSGITATGVNVKNTIYTPDGYRVVASDPRYVPLGTILEITYANGKKIKAKAVDTGGAIKGRKLDVLVASKAEAYELGRVGVQVRILGK